MGKGHLKKGMMGNGYKISHIRYSTYQYHIK